ncbi:MAG: YbaK/EbsC family protein [Lachnospiraceae bacterium]
METHSVEDTLRKKEVEYEILEYDRPFESTLDAMEMIGTTLERMGKTLAFRSQFGAIVVIVSGEAKVDNLKYKKRFGTRPLMLDADELMEYTGSVPGSVSPVGLQHKKVKVYMDASIKRFEEGMVYPSAGNDNSAIAISAKDLYTASDCKGYVDVCKDWK